jgi:hypothetical protein
MKISKPSERRNKMKSLFIILASFTFFSCASNMSALVGTNSDLNESDYKEEVKCVYERITGSYIKKRICYDNHLKITRQLETQSAIRQMDIFPMHLEPFYQ